MITTSTANDNNDCSDLNGQTFGNDSIEERVENGDSGKEKKKKNYDDKEKQPPCKPKPRRDTTYKYSNKGKGPLHEAVILDGNSVFLRYEDSQIKSIPQIEESSRIIVSPHPEEYPYEAYEFKIWTKFFLI